MTTTLLFDRSPFVAFVGGGVSTLPPSRLPTWTEFNNLLMETLCSRHDEQGGGGESVAELLAPFKRERGEARCFAPDFPAQLMEEEIGPGYFRAWQSLEAPVCGPVHHQLAELAAQSRVAAIVTTCFDRLMETALKARGIPFQVFHDRASFEDLATISAGWRGSALPVIKIHGSIEDQASLIDTLKQRLVGRPEPMLRALQVLLRQYPWLFLGCSGAEFSYDRHHLGILDAATQAAGFVFLARPGRAVENGVHMLAEAFEPRRAAIEMGDLRTWLAQTFGLAQSPVTDENADGGLDPLQDVRERLQEWTQGLSPTVVINLLFSMLKSAGNDAAAQHLLRQPWDTCRTCGDASGKSYERCNYNQGVALMERGLLRNPITLAADMSNADEWRMHADKNAYDYLARSFRSGQLPVAAARMAGVLALRGEVSRAVRMMTGLAEEAIARRTPLDLCDVAISSAVLYDIVQSFNDPLPLLRQCLVIARDLADEPRRGLLSAHLGRFLTYGRFFDEADEHITNAEGIGLRLNLRPVLLTAHAARGRWLVDSGTSAEDAVFMLGTLAATLQDEEYEPEAITSNRPSTHYRHPMICRVLLDLNRAAMIAGSESMMDESLDELNALATEAFPGYAPHYYLAYAQCLATHGDGNQRENAAVLIDKARDTGEFTGNPWAVKTADNLERLLGRAPVHAC